MIKLSIITINYNDYKGLQSTIESIMPHKIDDIEFIVIDGASRDGSVEVIRKYQQKIDYWVSEPDKGIYNAMNKGILKASGKYITFVNSGDILSSDDNLAELLQKTEDKDFVYFNLFIKDNTSEYLKLYPDYLDFKYFSEDTIPHTGTFIRRELFHKYGGYDETYKIVADWVFYIDCILNKNCTYKHIDYGVGTFYLGGLSSNPDNFKYLIQERDRCIKNNFPVYYTMYSEWKENKNNLYKIRSARSVKLIKKLGFLKWF